MIIQPRKPNDNTKENQMIIPNDNTKGSQTITKHQGKPNDNKAK